MASSLYRPSWTPGDTSGYREQLLEQAPSIVDHEDAPVFKGLEKVAVTQYRVDWLNDTLTAPTLPTPPVFDADPSYSFTDGRTRKYNQVQEFIVSFVVAEISNIIAGKGSVAGVKDELAYGLEKKIKELVRQIERVLMSEQAQAADDDTNPAKLEGFFATVSTYMTDTAAVTGNNFYSSISETDFQDKILSLFEAGTEGDLWCVAPPKFCVQVSRNFKGRVDVVRETQSRDDAKVNMKVEMYQAPVGGLVTLQPNRSMGEGVALVSKDFAKVGELRGITSKRTDTDQQHKRGFVNWYGTLLKIGRAHV